MVLGATIVDVGLVAQHDRIHRPEKARAASTRSEKNKNALYVQLRGADRRARHDFGGHSHNRNSAARTVGIFCMYERLAN